MTDTSSLRIGLVGVGYWGKNYLRLLRDMDGVELVFVVDKDPATLRLIPPSVPTFTSMLDALSSRPADAVVVVTPPSTHTQIALQCLRGGLHVLMEKPVALSSHDMRELTTASERAGRIFFPGHIYTHNDWIIALAGLAKAPAFGTLRYATSVRMGEGPRHVEVGALWDLAPHDLSILDLLGFGVPEEAMCLTRSYRGDPVEDVALAEIRYPSERTAQLHLSWHSIAKIRDLLVVGSHQRGRFIEDHSEGPLTLADTPSHGGSLPGEGGSVGKTPPVEDAPRPRIREPLRNMVDAFTEACRSGAPPQVQIDRAMNVTSTLEALDGSARAGGTWVKVEDSTA